jgi:dual-specificity kinase
MWSMTWQAVFVRPWSLVQNYGQQLLGAVAFLHTLNLVHTDLKPENILLLSSAYQR